MAPMNSFTGTGLLHLSASDMAHRNGNGRVRGEGVGSCRQPAPPPAAVPSAEVLRRCAWEIGERRAADAYVPPVNHVGLAMVTPIRGYAHWRMLPEWIDHVARQRGGAWHNSRPILRVYDVSLIHFNGFNAHRMQDLHVPGITGHMFFSVPRPGTAQIAEVGFLLTNGEFIPASRSHVVQFPADSVSPRHDHAALLVTDRFRVEEVGNLWEQERILSERARPRLRDRLRIATLSMESTPSGQAGTMARYVAELAAGQTEHGHEVHVFVPSSGGLPEDRQVGAVHYHALPVPNQGSPVDQALAYARAAEKRLDAMPAFDLFHLCDWMTGLAPWIGTRPTILSLSSIETIRRNGTPISQLSREIQQTEREVLHAVDAILTPDSLRDTVLAEFGIDDARVHGFPMEARLHNEWDCPLDLGEVKQSIGFGPVDRLLVYVGPLEHDAGMDLLIEALPTALRRVGNLRLAMVGVGGMEGGLRHRSRELGVSHAVHFLGHVDGWRLARILRSAEALMLPSRRRVFRDDAVVDLARRAGRPVVTTHAGPAYLVRHEETGLITYDNPGSMVWAFDRILGDPNHAEFMGRKGRRDGESSVSWSEAARRFFELCAHSFPQLRVDH
ncbi:MAG: DUF4912 domain-containing protein [Gemmataceae bacterium]|nr:DUF4912 domain-containing protein [Gemmataceae bacterium]